MTRKQVAREHGLSCSRMFHVPSMPSDACPDSTVLVPACEPRSGCQAAGLVKVTQAARGQGPELSTHSFQVCWPAGLRAAPEARG